MSSIYRKGRDGYFYYQTYILNDETGKKDKRIFHSLGTRNRSEAEGKQKEFDLRYEKGKPVKNKYDLKLIIQNNYKISSTVFFIILSSLLLFNVLDEPPTKETSHNYDFYAQNESAESSQQIIQIKNDTTSKNIKIKKNKLDSLGTIEKIINSKVKDIVANENNIPPFTLVRVNKLSDAFDQGEIFLTIKDNVSSDKMLSLCEHLTKKYSTFSNLIICLYSDTTIGQELASGKSRGISNDEQQKAWLAMYTFNAIEGAYFDDNPGGYLGAF